MAGNGRTPTLPDVEERLTAEVGHSGLRVYGGYVSEEYDVDLRGTRGAKIFDEMRRNDPTIAAGLRAVNWILGQVTWSVQPGGETPADQEAAEFLTSCMDDMSRTWSGTMRSALTCLPFGFAWLEVIYKLRQGPDADPPSRYDDGRVGWRKLVLIGQDTVLRWEFDESGGVKNLVQQGLVLPDGGFSPPTPVPIGKSVLFRLEEEKDNPEGISLLRPIVNPWYIKKQIQEIEAIGIERDLTGVLIIHLPVSATQTDHDNARNLLEQFKADDMAGFIAPTFGGGNHETWRFEIINSPGSKSIDTDKIVQRYQNEIARAFLAQFLMLGQNTGSWALAQDQRSLFEVALGAILLNFEETFNRFLVPPLFRLNDFGTLTALPQLKAGLVSKSDMKQFGTALSEMVKAGLLTTNYELEQYIRQEMHLPELPEPEETAAPTEDTGGQDKTASEPTPDEEREEPLPDPADDAAWRRIEEESNKRLGRSLREALRFARPYDYDDAVSKRAGQFQTDMQGLAERLRSGEIDYATWMQRSRERITVNVIDGYRIGTAEAQGVAPSKVVLTTEQRKAANALIEEQYKYFAGFAKDVKATTAKGEDLTGAVTTRAGMYSGSMKSAAEKGRMDSSAGKRMRWTRHKNDSCGTCLGMDGQVKTADEWHAGGVWPGHGTICHGNCGCSLDAV